MTENACRWYIGVDAGGTRTTALVGTSGDRIIGRGVAGPANPQVVGFDAAAEQIIGAIREALAGALAGNEGSISPDSVLRLLHRGKDGPGVQKITLGVAGCGRPTDRKRLTRLLAEQLGLHDTTVHVTTDVALLLPAAGLTSGVALVAGTGSSAFGVAPDGRTASAGGWGYLLGDDGSGFDVARQGLRAVLRAEDGLGPPTNLTAALKQALEVNHPRDLIRVIYQSPSPRVTVASLAPVVVAVARDGDATARQILASAGEVLGKLAGAVARRLGLGPDAAVIGTGGLFQAGDLIVDPLRRSLARAGLFDFRLSVTEPALGALRLATGEARLEVP